MKQLFDPPKRIVRPFTDLPLLVPMPTGPPGLKGERGEQGKGERNMSKASRTRASEAKASEARLRGGGTARER